jgi:acetyl esterase/lipase
MGWEAYLGGWEKVEREDVSIYAAPGRAESLEGLPPTYITIGGLGLFRDENLEFAAKLAKANNNVEFHLCPGLPHGWEGLGQNIAQSKEAAASRKRVLSDF